VGLVAKQEDGMEITKRRLADIVPYAANAKKHDKRQINNVAESIKQYGFVQPIVIDRDGVIVIGHCRALAAKKLGMEEVPCVCVDDLTPEQVNALRLVDNKSNESDWDVDLLAVELPGLDLSAFDFDFSFPELDESEIEEMTNEQREQEFRERMERGELSDDDEDYQAFLEKFEAKKTTDDCYTPENIYNVAKRWSLKKYKLGNPPVVRPFYPGGNYKKENYPKGCVVIDNPPFSIISEICEWYTENGIAYFLFAPTLTLLGIMRGKANYVACGSGVVYENGASVNTSFVTNLGSKKIIAASDLREQIDEANKENLAKQHKTLPKYEYPDEVLTATMLCYMAAHGVSLEICADDVHFIRGLDAQKESGKALFGSGYLLSKKAAAEKAAAEKAAAEKVRVRDTNVWELSDREKKIVAGLGHDD
jgi:ParB-like chromosome segregation protein Spo0J